MRRAGLLLGLLLALVAGAVWIAPRFLDWDRHRGELAALAAGRLGRPVTLDGPIRLVLLPQPVLEAAEVAVGDPVTGVLVAARAMRLRLDLGALLRGRFELREVVLVGADITLPWPPATTLALRPPPWLTTLDARIEDSRLRIGGVALDGVAARLSAGGALEAVQAEGAFAWRGLAIRFEATIGRPGYDGVATLDLTLAGAGAAATARGALLPEGGFEGRIDAAGSDLALLVPAPPGPFRGAGRLTASADLIAADDLTLDLGGAPARGAVSMRLAPLPRLDIALAASRADLDAWLAALRGAGAPPVPIALDLSAEAAAFRGATLRRLRAAALLEGGRLTLSDVSARLPGVTEIEAEGATAEGRLELALRFASEDLRAALAAFGWRLPATDPARLRGGVGRMRLSIEESQVAMQDLAAVVDGTRVSGAGVLRHGARPALGLGITLDRLRLDGLLPERPDWSALAERLGAVDANIRVAAEALSWRGSTLQRAALDAALEGGRITVRRFSGHLAGADLVLSGAVTPAPALRFADLTLEVIGGTSRGLLALLPGRLPDLGPVSALSGLPLALRVSGGGPAQAVALRAEADLGELRVEAQGTLDVLAGRGTASTTLRHPGAPRLATLLFGEGGGAWLGEGSFSLVANLALTEQGLASEHAELVAGLLRTRFALSLALDRARPRLAGRIAAERLPLPDWQWRAAEPFAIGALAGFDAEVAVEAARIEPLGSPALEAAGGTLLLEAGVLRLEGGRARLAGGTLQARGTLEPPEGDRPPRLSAAVTLSGATLTGAVFELPLDITAGVVEAELGLAATGFSPAAMLATMEGSAQIALRSGVLVGLDLAALAAASGAPDPEAAIRRALAGGATAFETLALVLRLEDGRAVLVEARLAGEPGVAATAAGEIDLAQARADLLVLARPGEGPEVGLRLTGPLADPRRLPELSGWARWRAERG